ncbi:MAG: hypothetical protein ACLQOO_23630 [Terriglobia bacterium]
MPQNQSQEKAGSLQALAEAHFERDFTVAERNLLASAPKGKIAYCGPSHDPKDPSSDPSKAEKSPAWGPEREIDAKLIRWLCVDRKAREQVDPVGIWIQAAKVTGKLDLSYVVAPVRIRLWNCVLTKGAELYQVEVPRLDLEGSWTKSISADGAIVKGNVVLSNGFHSEGAVRLLAAQIGGDLECEGGTFNNPGGLALGADGAEVKEGVFLRGFSAQGEVRLLEAQIGANLECDGGTFSNPGGFALNAERVGVKGNVFLRTGFSAQGTATLADAHIEGDLNCTGGTFKGATLDLRDASASVIWDDPNSWPQPGKLLLDGFVYRRIGGKPKDAKTRLDWLKLQPEKPFATQPYLQLAKVLREAGDDDGAKTVLVAMEDEERSGDMLRPVLKWSIGYGQHPWWAGWWALGFTALGWILYRRSYLSGGIVPTEEKACGEFKPAGQIPRSYGRFFPSIYSLENSLPLVKLGQADKWQPDPDPGASPSRDGIWIKSAARDKSWPGWLRGPERLLIFAGLLAPADLKDPPSRFSRIGTSPRFLRWFLWFQILLGWLLATLFIAGVTGIIHQG